MSRAPVTDPPTEIVELHGHPPLDRDRVRSARSACACAFVASTARAELRPLLARRAREAA